MKTGQPPTGAREDEGGIHTVLQTFSLADWRPATVGKSRVFLAMLWARVAAYSYS